jgi:serine/threonine protein kinase
VARVFLSHAGPDKSAVRRIATALRAAGHDPWLDEEEILVGDSIPAAVERGLREADFVVLCLSKVAAERGWVEAERDATLMQQFSDRKERILPVRLEDVAPPHLIAPIAYVDLFPDEQAFHRGIARLTRSIAMHTARHATTDDASAGRPRGAANALPAAGAASGSRPMARNAASPTPAYLNAEVQALSEQLERARERKRNLHDSGIATDRVDQEILELRRKLRDGGQLRAGDSLGDGRYLLIKPVGRGGFAVVWEAWDREGQQRVAIKVLHQHLASDPQRRERFFRGARVMMELNHPAVVRVHDPSGQDDSFCYFVMELVPGGDLREAVLGKRVAAERRLALILQVGEALAQAHSKGMVHRDIKPANILLDEHGNAKLTDFDLVGARDTTGGTRTGALGTVVYAAPECLERPQEATSRADVYGLGMTALFCLAGEELSLSAFRDPEAVIARLDCSAAVRNVLQRAVAWEPEVRFADASALVAELSSASANRDIELAHGAPSVPSMSAMDRAPDAPSHGSSGEQPRLTDTQVVKRRRTSSVTRYSKSGLLVVVLVGALLVRCAIHDQAAGVEHDVAMLSDAGVPRDAQAPVDTSQQAVDSAVEARSGASQAELAARFNEEGKELMYKDEYAEAAKKFQEAVARVPEAKYFINLCTARLQEGKLDEALTACSFVALNNPNPDQESRAKTMIMRINDEANRQHLKLHPIGGNPTAAPKHDPPRPLAPNQPQQPTYTPATGKPLDAKHDVER